MSQAELRPFSVLFLHSEVDNPCRCGNASLNEPCAVCEQYVCQDCATFVDPQTKQPTRPSLLMAQRVQGGFLAHIGCVPQKEQRAVPCVYNEDIPLMIQILKGNDGIGRALNMSR